LKYDYGCCAEFNFRHFSQIDGQKVLRINMEIVGNSGVEIIVEISLADRNA
jgi:hypothetical protein